MTLDRIRAAARDTEPDTPAQTATDPPRSRLSPTAANPDRLDGLPIATPTVLSSRTPPNNTAATRSASLARGDLVRWQHDGVTRLGVVENPLRDGKIRVRPINTLSRAFALPAGALTRMATYAQLLTEAAAR